MVLCARTADIGAFQISVRVLDPIEIAELDDLVRIVLRGILVLLVEEEPIG
jgi:hypothetical protein